MAESVGQAPPNYSLSEVVSDGYSDIAKTFYLEQMMVEADGRGNFQQVYLWTASGSEAGSSGKGKAKAGKGATTVKYEPQEDGPTAHSLCPILPQGEELVPATNTKLYLEVGLLIGDNPSKYQPLGLSRNKETVRKREKRGVLRRDNGAMRVFTPMTDYIAPQTKFYVGCRIADGRLSPRVIDMTNVFFYQEFWRGIGEDLPAKVRKAELAKACKHAAALQKGDFNRITAPITQNDVSKVALANPLAATRAEHLVSKIVLMYSLFETTGDQNYTQSIRSCLKEANSSLNYGPLTANNGTDAFLDFEKELSEANACLVASELAVSSPGIGTLRTDIIRRVHQVLRDSDETNASNSPGTPLGEQLYPSTLGFFLRVCDFKISSPSLDTDIIKGLVKEALTLANFHKQEQRDGLKSSFNHWKGSKKGAAEDNGGLAAEFHLVVSATRDGIAMLDSFLERSEKAVAEKHGAILPHTSVEDIMNKLANAIDTSHVRSLHEQLAALHAATYITKNREMMELLRGIDKYLGDVLISIEKRMKGE